jgi:hypothetical protein
MLTTTGSFDYYYDVDQATGAALARSGRRKTSEISRE